MDRHAFLIMAHHRPDLLRLILSALDDDRNDIFIHIDLKAKNLNWDLKTRKAKLNIIEPMSVNWGGYTQIECEYRLLKEAVKEGYHQYYHLLTGATYPLMNQSEMHDFFDAHQGTEFVGFDNKRDFSARVKYDYLFCEEGKVPGFQGKVKFYLRDAYLKIQEIFGVNHFEKYQLECKKGIAYWSITQACAKYILDNELIIQEMLNKSISGDEVFVQTLVYNSKFKDKLYSTDDEYEGAVREFAWENVGAGSGHDFTMKHLDFLLNSKNCFALKFDGPDGLKLIKEIRKNKNI